MFKKKPEVKVRVMFVDEKNDCTSQLAEYYAKQLYPDTYDIYSAGPKHDLVDCDLISVMYVAGEDMRRQVSKDFKDTDHLREDDNYDLIVYTEKKTFDEWAPKTPWQGKQILADMGSVKDYHPTDDAELGHAYEQLADKIRLWVSENMKDPEKLRSLVTA